MKIISFHDGLGNQLFQYRLYSYFRTKNPKEKIFGYYNPKWLKAHNGLEIFKLFEVEKPQTNIFIPLVCLILRLIDKFLPIISRDTNPSYNAILHIGYWQNKDLWGKNMSPIPFKNPKLNEKNKYILSLIEKTYSVSIHIRRGDYLLPQNSIYNICNQDYYYHAINTANKINRNVCFFIFSDDPKWVEDNLKIENSYYVNINKGPNSYIDMYLMSKCKASILANSTFSYWGAINGRNKDFVIYPQKWILKTTRKSPNIFKKDWIAL